MEKIITLENGRMFKIDNIEFLTPEHENSIINQLTTKISGLASGCGSIIKGTSKNIKATASGGTGKYYFELHINGNKVADSGTSYIPAASLPYVFPYTFNNVGSINVMIKAKDDCSGAAFSNDSCTVTVTEGTSNLSTIELTGCDAVHVIGDDCTITPICKDSSGNVVTCPTLTWTSSSPSKVSVTSTINNKGLCTFLANGSSTITASSGGVSGSKTVTSGSISSKPILTSITPTSTKTDEPVHFIVTGSNFSSDATVEFKLTPDGYPIIGPFQDDATRTPTKIEWDVTFQQVNMYESVRVKNGDGQLSDNVLTFNAYKDEPANKAGIGWLLAFGLGAGYLLSRKPV
jgi:hypothetical protein